MARGKIYTTPERTHKIRQIVIDQLKTGKNDRQVVESTGASISYVAKLRAMLDLPLVHLSREQLMTVLAALINTTDPHTWIATKYNVSNTTVADIHRDARAAGIDIPVRPRGRMRKNTDQQKKRGKE